MLPAKTVYVDSVRVPLNGLSSIADGSGPLDGGHLLLSKDERDKILSSSPNAAPFIRLFLGSEEIVNGLQRWCIWIEDSNYKEALDIPEINVLVSRVKNFREGAGTRAKTAISRPHRFAWINRPEYQQIAIPKVVSERRPYLTAQLLGPETIVSNRACILLDPQHYELAILSSKLHWVWIGTVCVRLEMRFSYSGTIGWNTFPVPTLTEQNKADLTKCAEDILLAREAHFPKTIAELYDPETMPENLRLAHERNDEVLERIYIGRRFKNDTERLEKLFDMYTRMTAATAKAKPVTRAKRARA